MTALIVDAASPHSVWQTLERSLELAQDEATNPKKLVQNFIVAVQGVSSHAFEVGISAPQKQTTVMSFQSALLSALCVVIVDWGGEGDFADSVRRVVREIRMGIEADKRASALAAGLHLPGVH